LRFFYLDKSMRNVDMDLDTSLRESPLLEELFASIAHQWRGPLSQINSIIGNLDNRLYELEINDSIITEQLLQIEAITKQMSQSIDDYRGILSKKQRSSSLKELVLAALASTSVSLMENKIKVEHDVEIPVQLHGDDQLLKQVIVTLLDNARDALVSRNIYKPFIKISTEYNKDFLFIKVCDNAGGMSKSVKSKVFEPDFTTKHSSEGTGLGLFMAKKLLSEKMHASLSVKNVESGVCFTIEIPRNKNE